MSFVTDPTVQQNVQFNQTDSGLAPDVRPPADQPSDSGQKQQEEAENYPSLDEVLASLRGQQTQQTQQQQQQQQTPPPQQQTPPPFDQDPFFKAFQPPPSWVQPELPPPPQIDRSLLIPEVVEAKKSEITARYSAAWHHAQDETQRQAIQMAHAAELAQFDAKVERAKIQAERYEHEVKLAKQRAMTEPLYRQIVAQKLSERYKVPVEQLLKTPWGEEITDPARMLDAALYLSSLRARENAQQQASQSVAPSTTGGPRVSDFAERVRRASPEEFQKLVEQAMRTGIKI